MKEAGINVDDIKNYTSAEANTLAKYRGPGYKKINDALRAGDASDPMVKKLDAVIQKSKLKDDVELYRGMTLPKGTTLKPGDAMKFDGYLSTTADARIARMYTRPDPRAPKTETEPAMLVINAKKGTPVGHPDAGAWTKQAGARANVTYREQTFARGSQIHVTKVERVGGMTRIHADLK